MDKLSRMLIAGPLEFAAIFGEVTSDAVPETHAVATGSPRGATAVAGAGSPRRNGPRGSRKDGKTSNLTKEIDDEE